MSLAFVTAFSSVEQQSAVINDPRFAVCLPLILKEEGGNDDDPQDHGGRTSRGIIQREYTSWRRKRGLPDCDVFQASDDEIRAIYFEKYWAKRAPKLHAGVDLVWFNFAVNAGSDEADKLLMRSISDSPDDSLTVNRMCNEGEVFYRGLAQFSRYGNGWTHRTERIRVAALKMVTYSPHGPIVPPATQPHPASPDPPIINPTGGHIMVDVTQIEKDVNIGLSTLENILPFLSLLVGPQVAGWITAGINGVRTIEGTLGVSPTPTSAALAQSTSHNTAGAPNAPALSGG